MVRSEPANTRPAASSASEEIADALMNTLGHLVLAAIKTIWMLACWAVAFPMLSLPLLGSLALGHRYGWPLAGIAAGACLLILLGWRLTGPASFHRLISGRIWKRWRRWWVYRRAWRETCALHGLTAPLNDDVLVPRLHRVKIGYASDRVTVRMLVGQTLTDWQQQSEALANGFGALAVRVRPLKPGWLTLDVQHTDPLANPIPLPAPSSPADLERVTVGIVETGRPWRLRLLGRHVLVAGATGAGKGSVIWSLLAGIAPAIRDGLVQAWVIDPKGGMEFGPGAALFHRFAYDNGEQTLQLFRDAAWLMSTRALALRGHARQHTPSPAEPLIVLVIDEIATLTSYITDRKMRTEVEHLLGLLLSQGRAVGVSVIACVQDPAKDVLALRQLFPIRVALRLTEPTQAAMVLGQAARDRGALCELIPDSLPGVGYLSEDGTTEITRARAFHVTDNDIDHLAATYRPRSAGGEAGSGASWSEAA